MSKAVTIFHEKKLIENETTGDLAVVEIKVWKVTTTKHYPEGIKYSLYLVSHGEIIVGFDNHSPKGHHLHLGKKEILYLFTSIEKLLKDFWDLVLEKGFKL